MDNNLPENCQGRGTHLPWNQEETKSASDLLDELIDGGTVSLEGEWFELHEITYRLETDYLQVAVQEQLTGEDEKSIRKLYIKEIQWMMG